VTISGDRLAYSMKIGYTGTVWRHYKISYFEPINSNCYDPLQGELSQAASEAWIEQQRMPDSFIQRLSIMERESTELSAARRQGALVLARSIGFHADAFLVAPVCELLAADADVGVRSEARQLIRDLGIKPLNSLSS
jgi:hypothetical protein